MGIIGTVGKLSGIHIIHITQSTQSTQNTQKTLPKSSLRNPTPQSTADKKSRRWAVLKRTAHCRDFLLAAVDEE